MTLQQFAEKLQSLLANPNALVVSDNTLYIYTKDCELIALHVPFC